MQQQWAAAAELARAHTPAAPFAVVGEPQGRLPLKPAASAPVQLPPAAAILAPAAGKRVLGGGIAQVQGSIIIWGIILHVLYLSKHVSTAHHTVVSKREWLAKQLFPHG